MLELEDLIKKTIADEKIDPLIKSQILVNLAQAVGNLAVAEIANK